MADHGQDIDHLRQVMKKLASDVETLKKGLEAANDVIENLRTEVVNLKTAQIARGHDPD